jgi:hypothetical protein
VEEENVTSMTENPSSREHLARLIGGLSIIPYGIYTILSALAFALGWLDWKTNDGPPFLGYLLALVFDKLIRRYYDKKYGFSFDKTSSLSTDPRPMSMVIIVVVVLGIIVAWIIDATLYPAVRLLPLWFGALLCLQGFVWLRTSWKSYGWIHLVLGISFIGLSFLPLILNTTSNNHYLGADGVLELMIIGAGAITIGVMEHRILQKYSVAAGHSLR